MMWEGNILFILKYRELGNWRIPGNAQHKVLRKLLTFNGLRFKKICRLYTDHNIYYDNYQLYHGEYGEREDLHASSYLIKSFNIEKESSTKIDTLFPVTPTSCTCNGKNCLCFKKYIICITFDGWLLRFDCETGVIVDKIFVKTANYRYHYCTWSGLEDLYALKGNLDVETEAERCRMAIFDSKLMFKYVFEVEQRVFGTEYLDASINKQLFVVLIDKIAQFYSFADLLKEGVLVSEDPFQQESNEEGRKTLKINFKIEKAPPVLLYVDCFGNSFKFGIDPRLWLFRKTRSIFVLKNLKQETEACIDIDQVNDNETDLNYSDSVIFHPYFPYTIIVKQKQSLHCHKIVDFLDSVELQEALVLQFPDSYPSSPCVPTEKSTIFAINFEKSLGLIGILGYHRKDPERKGFVKLFDGSSGEEVGSIKLQGFIKETNMYSLLIDLDMVVVVEKYQEDCSWKYYSIVYGLCRRKRQDDSCMSWMSYGSFSKEPHELRPIS